MPSRLSNDESVCPRLASWCLPPLYANRQASRYADDAEKPSRFECQLCRMIRLVISTRNWKRPDGAESRMNPATQQIQSRKALGQPRPSGYGFFLKKYCANQRKLCVHKPKRSEPEAEDAWYRQCKNGKGVQINIYCAHKPPQSLAASCGGYRILWSKTRGIEHGSCVHTRGGSVPRLQRMYGAEDSRLEACHSFVCALIFPFLFFFLISLLALQCTLSAFNGLRFSPPDDNQAINS